MKRLIYLAAFLAGPALAQLTGVTTTSTQTLTNKTISGASNTITNIPISTGISGLGTGVATALGVNIGSAGAPVLFNGAGGTPSSITLTNASGTAASLTAGTVTTNANLTGVVTSVGNATSFAASPTFTGTTTTAALSSTGLHTIAQATANTAVLAASGHSLTGSNNTTGYSFASTLNTTGANYDLFKIAATVTATGAATNLFSVYGGASATTPRLIVTALGNVGIGVQPAVSRNLVISQEGLFGSIVQYSAANDTGFLTYVQASGPTPTLAATYSATGAYAPMAFQTSGLTRVTIPVTGGLALGASADAILTTPGAATLQLGAATGSGAAVAQTLQNQGSTGNSAAAALFTIAGSDQSGTTTTGGGVKIRGGNGTSAGGAVEIWTSATTTPAVAVSFAADKTATFAGSFVLTTSATPLAADACTAGRIVWGADYIYVCTASGAWKRAAITGGY